MEEIFTKRNGIIVDILTGVDIVETVKDGDVISEIFEGFFCHNLDFNPYTKFVTDKIEKRDSFNSQGKDSLQSLAKQMGSSVHVDNNEKDINKK